MEAAGLKRARIGGACVSEKHAKLIINSGGVTAADIERLIERVRDQVVASSGVQLPTDVRIIGDPAGGAQ